MIKILIISIVLFQMPLWSKEVKLNLLSFNIMCEFCHKNDLDKFEKRVKGIKQTINNRSPDVIALQEVTRKSQLLELINEKEYHLVFYENSFISYPDAVLAINKDRFKILDQGSYWLGENNGDFSVGWKWALPRLYAWAKVQLRETKQEITFISTHFDNRIENLLGSADVINKLALKKKNIIFMGDTNSTPEMESYKILTKNLKDLAINFEGDRKYCYLKKGKQFPACRVDHVMSNIQKIRTTKYDVITEKFNDRFPSDHRAINIQVELEL